MSPDKSFQATFLSRFAEYASREYWVRLEILASESGIWGEYVIDDKNSKKHAQLEEWLAEV